MSQNPQKAPYPERFNTDNLILQKGADEIEPGEIGWNSNRKIIEWNDGSGIEWPSFVDNGDVSTSTKTVSNTTSETEVVRDGVDQNALVQGRVLIIRAFGNYSTAASDDNFTVRVYVGDMGFDPIGANEGTKVAEVSSLQENVSSGPWSTKITATVFSEGSNGELYTHTNGKFNDTDDDDHGGAITVDTNTGEEIVTTVKWNNAKSGNTFTRAQAYLQQQA